MNTVDHPTATRLKEAGWTGETEYRHVRFGAIWKLLHEGEYGFYGPYGNSDWLPAPNIAELRESLTEEDFEHYYLDAIFSTDEYRKTIGPTFMRWLYAVTADPNTLAQIWLQRNSKKESHIGNILGTILNAQKNKEAP